MINERKREEFRLFSTKWRENSKGEIVCNLEHQQREEDNERPCKIRIGIEKLSLSMYEAIIYLYILYGKDPNDHITLNFSVKIGSLKECLEYLDDYLQHICLDPDKKATRYKCAFYTKNESNEIEELPEHSFTFEAKYYCIAEKISLMYGYELLSKLNSRYYQQRGYGTSGAFDQYWNWGTAVDSHSFSFSLSGRNESEPDDRLLVVVYELE